MNGYLTTHVLDMTQGLPAENVQIDLWQLDADGSRTFLQTFKTNSDGRVDGPLLEGDNMTSGEYELIFHAASYFQSQEHATSKPPFLTEVPVRFGISDTNAHYHVPLLMAPGGYSTYRGS